MPYIKYKTEGLTSLREAARITGLAYGRFWRQVYFHDHIETPATTVGRRRYYTHEQLQRVIEQVAALRIKGVL